MSNDDVRRRCRLGAASLRTDPATGRGAGAAARLDVADAAGGGPFGAAADAAGAATSDARIAATMVTGRWSGEVNTVLSVTQVMTALQVYALTRHPHNVPTPAELLAAQLRRDPSRPLLTFYDDATGERVELSVATTANWVAKTANFLVDEYGVDPGDAIGIALPLHWQTAVVILAAWEVGATVRFDGHGVVDVVLAGAAPGGDGEIVELSLAPMGADFSRLVAAQPDQFHPTDATGEDVVDGAPIDLPAGSRVLSVLALSDPAGLGYGLIAPLVVDGSVVYVANAAAGRLGDRAVAEQVTHTLGVDIGGLPRL